MTQRFRTFEYSCKRDIGLPLRHSLHSLPGKRSRVHRMPLRTSRAAGSSHDARVERARQFLSGGGVNREDSDDELGLEDHPWQWVYSTNNGHESHNTALDTSVQEPLGKAGPRPRRRNDISRHAEHTGQRRIVGAHMGTFKCMIGDCVLLKAEGTKEAWVGLICEFQEEEDEGDAKAANFMWFSTDKEIRNKQKKRTDALQVRCNCALATFSRCHVLPTD